MKIKTCVQFHIAPPWVKIALFSYEHTLKPYAQEVPSIMIIRWSQQLQLRINLRIIICKCDLRGRISHSVDCREISSIFKGSQLLFIILYTVVFELCSCEQHYLQLLILSSPASEYNITINNR
jgi:hypothetical protein